MGSKSRIAKYIVPIIQQYIDTNAIDSYYEPFVGGCNVIDKIRCQHKIGSDINPYLIALLKHVQQDLPLYETVDRELYDKARDAWRNGNTSGEFEDWQLGCIGFLSSFNGKGFEGGYAKPGYEKNGRYRDYYQEAKRNLLKQAPNLKDITFNCCDYTSYTPQNMLIYCDPPYSNTTQYNSMTFNSEEFWQIMREWSKDNIVLISEENAPDDFECIWEQEVSRSLNAANKTRATEKLFRYRGEKYDSK